MRPTVSGAGDCGPGEAGGRSGGGAVFGEVTSRGTCTFHLSAGPDLATALLPDLGEDPPGGQPPPRETAEGS